MALAGYGKRENLYAYSVLENHLKDKLKIGHNIIFLDIIKNLNLTPEAALLHFDKYQLTNSRYERGAIRYGENYREEYAKVMKSRKLGKTNSTWVKEYWIKKGFTDEESDLKVSEIQSKNGKKQKYDKSQHPTHIEYYINQGLSKDDAVLAREEFLDNTSAMRNLHKLSPEEYEIFLRRYEKTKKTKNERYGGSFVRTFASKASLKFFIPLYKKIRRLGVARNDVMWGIRGSKEFYTNYDSKNYGFDFTIRSKRIIIEFHGTFWHPKPGDDNWKNPYTTLEAANKKEIIKKNIAESLGFTYIIVWSDSDFTIEQNKILNLL